MVMQRSEVLCKICQQLSTACACSKRLGFRQQMCSAGQCNLILFGLLPTALTECPLSVILTQQRSTVRHRVT